MLFRRLAVVPSAISQNLVGVVIKRLCMHSVAGKFHLAESNDWQN